MTLLYEQQLKIEDQAAKLVDSEAKLKDTTKKNNTPTKKLNKASDNFSRAKSKVFALVEKLSSIDPQISLKIQATPPKNQTNPAKINPKIQERLLSQVTTPS